MAGKDYCGSTVLDMLGSNEMTEQTDWRAYKQLRVLHLERCEVFKSFRHYLRSHAAKPVVERSVGERHRERRQSAILFERTRRRHCQSNIRTDLNGNIGETFKIRDESIWVFSSVQKPAWTEFK